MWLSSWEWVNIPVLVEVKLRSQLSQQMDFFTELERWDTTLLTIGAVRVVQN